MPSSIKSNCSNSSSSGSYVSINSDESIVSSEAFGRRLGRNLEKFKKIKQPEYNGPVIDLESPTPSASTDTNQRNFSSKWSGIGKSTKTIGRTFENDRYAQRNLRDPLPETTAFGLRTIDKHAKDTSPYPPPDETQKRFNAKFPAPCPPKEEDLPFYNRVEYFLKAQEWVEDDIKKSNNDKAWFETFIKEKIQFNVVDTNLDKLQFGSLRKGFAASQVIHPDLGRMKELITCNLCEQIALLPKNCAVCSHIYCLGCVRWLQSLPADLGLEKINVADKFMCITSSCVIATPLNGYPRYIEVQNPEVKKLYSEATFKCHRQFCEALISANSLIYHLQRCRNGPIIYEFDKTLQLNFASGPVREELNRKTISLQSILPAHLKLQEPNKTHEQVWHKRALGYAFFSKNFKLKPEEFNPLMIRAQTNFTNNYWNNVARQKDPTEPIDEAEQFALAIGFPSCSSKPIPEVKRRWPTTSCPRIPDYLLNASINWKRWSKYVDPDDTDSVTTTSSNVLYAIDIEDSQTPFIRIDPYERLAPAEAENVQDWLKENFPSCANPESMYKEPNTTSKQVQVLTRERKRSMLADSFKNRPKANIPPLLESQLKVIDDMSVNCPDKHLTFSISMFCISVWENGRMKPRPCWVLIMDGNLEVVYETFVKYREIEYIDSKWYGLTPRHLKYARNLWTVRDQVVKYLACATRIVGYGLINHLINLGMSIDEIKLLHPRMRDVNNYYSPYQEHPMNLNAIAFLWFTGYTLPTEPHSPAVETVTALRLYFLQWSDIERMASTHGGIHNENVQFTCGNRVTSALLHEFEEGIKKGICNWPNEWQNNRRITIPVFNENCVLPSKEMLKQTAELCKIKNFQTVNTNSNANSETYQVPKLSQSPQSRAKRMYKAIMDAKRYETIPETIKRAAEEEDSNPRSSKRTLSRSSSVGSVLSESSKTSKSSASSNNTVIFIDSDLKYQEIPGDDEWD